MLAKFKRISILSMLLFTSLICQGQTDEVLGKWKTIDDETGEAKSVVEIYKSGENVHGKIIKLYVPEGENQDPLCGECPRDDERYNIKVIGMEIMRGLRKDGREYSGGTVLKPDDGKVYKCKIWREGNDLKVRGYWGVFYRTQTWIKYN